MNRFIPLNKTFWTYHSLGCLLVMFSYFLRHSYSGGDLVTLTATNFIGMLLVTVTVLLFRYCYKQYQWQLISNSNMLLIGFIFATLAGFLIAVVLSYITQPIFLAKQIAGLTDEQAHKVIINTLEFLTFTYLVIVCGWTFIYIYISENKRVKDAEVVNLQLQNSLKDAQLSSLTSQLNPHFLFNSLNNIRFVIHENPQIADRMVTDLSHILRYSLESDSKEKVPLAQELEVVEKFIDIQKIQLESRLTFTLNCNFEYQHCLVPPMSLQLLVENAIKHGIEQLPQGGSVVVNITCDDSCLYFVVHNDKPVENNNMLLTNTTKLGLKNIIQRLSLLYGEQASISKQNSVNSYKVKITIPKET